MPSRCPALAVALIASATATAQPFVDRTTDLGLTLDNGPACWGDINGDGWPDLACARAVWINRQGESFDRIAAPATGMLADLEGDGDADLVSFAPIGVFRNTATAPGDDPVFEPIALPELPDTRSRGCAVGDFNGDGRLDIYFGGYEVWDPQTTFPDLLLLADDNGGFTLALAHDDYRARGVTACDFDGDADLDVYVSNYRLMPNVLWINDGSGSFTDHALERNALATSDGFRGGHSIGACWGDFDSDGRFDLFAGNFAHVDSRGDQPKSRFLRNQGPDADPPYSFRDLGECGVWYQESYASPAAGDFDNDGDLDLFFTTVYADASFGKKNHPVLYRNDTEPGAQAWTFTDMTESSGLGSLPPTYQAAWADFDRDGDLDLVTAGKLFENKAEPTNHWIGLCLRPSPDQPITIGAQARVALPDGRVVARQIECGTGEGNANSPLLHFGLGAHPGPVTIEVRWPNGTRQLLDAIAVDQYIDLQRDSTLSPSPPAAPDSPDAGDAVRPPR